MPRKRTRHRTPESHKTVKWSYCVFKKPRLFTRWNIRYTGLYRWFCAWEILEFLKIIQILPFSSKSSINFSFAFNSTNCLGLLFLTMSIISTGQFDRHPSHTELSQHMTTYTKLLSVKWFYSSTLCWLQVVLSCRCLWVFTVYEDRQFYIDSQLPALSLFLILQNLLRLLTRWKQRQSCWSWHKGEGVSTLLQCLCRSVPQTSLSEWDRSL